MYTLRKRVRFYETDGMRVVYHGNYLNWFEEARVEYMREGGVCLNDLLAEGIVAAASEVGLNVPLVVRFEGTNKDEAKEILKHSKLPLIIADSMEDSVDKLIAAMEASD